MKKILIQLTILLISFSSNGQSNTKNILPENLTVEGTYQIQVINTRDHPFIPSNIEEIVIKNRQQSIISYYKLSDYVRIEILPLDVIDSPNFEPITLIKYLQE